MGGVFESTEDPSFVLSTPRGKVLQYVGYMIMTCDGVVGIKFVKHKKYPQTQLLGAITIRVLAHRARLRSSPLPRRTGRRRIAAVRGIVVARATTLGFQSIERGFGNRLFARPTIRALAVPAAGRDRGGRDLGLWPHRS